MNKTYLVKLQPLGNFYFGSERNFQGGESYYARSLMFPQQTTLLGVLRYKLLQSHGLLNWNNHGRQITDSSAANLIGEIGFSAKNFADAMNYGVIKGLSHLFLMRGDDEIFCPGNLDYDYTFVIDGDGRSLMDRDRPFVPRLGGFDVKHQPSPRMVSNKGKELHYENEIFKGVEQVGNFKTKRRLEDRGKTEDREGEKGFYKQVFYRFVDPGANWRFAFLANIEVSAGEKLMDYTDNRGRLTHIGGERSPFNFLVEPCHDEFLARLSSEAFYSTSAVKNLTKAVLLSDACTDESVFEACDFSVTETVDFRFLSSSVHTENYHKLGEKGVQKSQTKYNLLKRGSVFYISKDKVEVFRKIMERPKAFCQVGFNSYLLVNSRTELHSWITG